MLRSGGAPLDFGAAWRAQRWLPYAALPISSFLRSPSLLCETRNRGFMITGERSRCGSAREPQENRANGKTPAKRGNCSSGLQPVCSLTFSALPPHTKCRCLRRVFVFGSSSKASAPRRKGTESGTKNCREHDTHVKHMRAAKSLTVRIRYQNDLACAAQISGAQHSTFRCSTTVSFAPANLSPGRYPAIFEANSETRS